MGNPKRSKKLLNERDNYMWQQWVNGILGLWVIVASYMYLSSGTARTVMLITGIIVAILGFWGGAVSPTEGRTHQGQM